MAKPKRCDLAGANCVRFALDGSLLVAADRGVFRIDPATAKARKLFAAKYQAGPLALSADGKTLFVGDDKHVHVVPIPARPRARAKLTASGDSVMSCAPSPDGKRVLVVGSDEGGTLKCFELGKPRAVYTIGSVRYAQTAWLPDGKRFVTASIDWNAEVRVHDATNGSVLVDLGDPHPSRADAGDNPGPSIEAIVIEPGGNAWLGSRYGLAQLIDGAKPTWRLRDHDVRALALAGSRLAIGCGDGSIHIMELRTTKMLATMPAGAAVLSLAYSRDGKQLAYVIDGAVEWRKPAF